MSIPNEFISGLNAFAYIFGVMYTIAERYIMYIAITNL